MNLKFAPFSDRAGILITDLSQKVNIITSALALAISNQQHLPTSEVDDPQNYFNTQLLPHIQSLIAEWNENVILNVRDAIEQTRIFWMIRYTAAYPASRPMYSFTYDFFDTISGVCYLVPPDLHKFLDGEHKQTILSLATDASNILLTK